MFTTVMVSHGVLGKPISVTETSLSKPNAMSQILNTLPGRKLLQVNVPKLEQLKETAKSKPYPYILQAWLLPLSLTSQAFFSRKFFYRSYYQILNKLLFPEKVKKSLFTLNLGAWLWTLKIFAQMYVYLKILCYLHVRLKHFWKKKIQVLHLFLQKILFDRSRIKEKKC